MVRSKSVLSILVCLLALASVALADEAAGATPQKQDTPGPIGGDRTMTVIREPLTEREIAEHVALGKVSQLDLVAREKVIQHLTDYLPADWKQASEPWGRVDSHGEAIVNEVPGWPGWTERNVAALRDEISRQVARREAAPAEQRLEAERVLGNFLAQAIIRNIDVDDLVDLEAVVRSSHVIAREVREQLHFYENVRAMHVEDAAQVYTPTVYPQRARDLVESTGTSLGEVQTLDAKTLLPTDMCYSRETFARGMALISGATVIWSLTGDDDAQADIPTGFHFYFNACEDPDVNDNIRVSTNGYITFYQQGGGADNGTDFSNDPIPDAAHYPDGYVAPAWDDYWVAPAQGNTDKVTYLVEGAVGSRVLTVEWFSISHNGGGTDDWHFFQVKLFEANGNLELHLSTDWSEDVGADSATIGMESFDGSVGACGPNCTNSIFNADIVDNYRFVPLRPSNDDSLAWACLASDSAVVSNNYYATGTDLSSCSSNDFKDVWYTYHAPTNQNVTFATCTGATFDTTLAVFDSAATTQIGCDDDGCGTQSQLTVALAGETDYKVRVAGYNGLQGSFTLTATPDVTGGGDDCGIAWPIAGDSSAYMRTSTNSGCVDETSCAYFDVVDEWFAWTPATTGRALVSTIDPYTDFDTSLAAFASCGGAELVCDDDSYSLQSQIFFPVVAGNTYYLRVAGWNAQFGYYRLTTQVCLFCDELETGDTSGWNVTVP